MCSFIAFPNHYYVNFSRVDAVMVKHTDNTVSVEFEIYGFGGKLVSIHADTTRLNSQELDRMKVSIVNEIASLEGVITENIVTRIIKLWVQARALSELSNS